MLNALGIECFLIFLSYHIEWSMKGKELLAYCGLYCGDCAGHTGAIADAADELQNVLKNYKFELTARHLFSDELKEYDKFVEMLGFMAKLKCDSPCREKTDKNTSCEIRKCCIEKGYYACYECDDIEVCKKLESMKGLHRDSCVKNLQAIKEIGLEKWVETGKRYWFGSDVDSE